MKLPETVSLDARDVDLFTCTYSEPSQTSDQSLQFPVLWEFRLVNTPAASTSLFYSHGLELVKASPLPALTQQHCAQSHRTRGA